MAELQDTGSAETRVWWRRLHGALMPDYNRQTMAYWWITVLVGAVVLAHALHETVVFRVLLGFPLSGLVEFERRRMDTVASAEGVAATAQPLLPVAIGHLKPARGKGRNLFGRLLGERDRLERGDDSAEVARHEPPAAQLFQQLGHPIRRTLSMADDHHRILRHLEHEGAARIGVRSFALESERKAGN